MTSSPVGTPIRDALDDEYGYHSDALLGQVAKLELALAAAQAELANMTHSRNLNHTVAKEALDQRDAAQADARGLREALAGIASRPCSYYTNTGSSCRSHKTVPACAPCSARAALKAQETALAPPVKP